MIEHEKLRTRLKNISKNATEYRMSVSEAKALLKEFDEKVTVPANTPVKPINVDKIEILDGGTF